MGFTDASNLGATIREARRDRGWSQTELADRAGVSRQWLSLVENGKTSVEFDLVVDTLAALGLAFAVQPNPDAGLSTIESTGVQRTPLTSGGQPLRKKSTPSQSRGTRWPS